MNIYLGADHRGFDLKEKLKPWLISAGHTVHDVGAAELTPDDDYPDFAIAVAQAVQQGTKARGIVLCGSGIGMAVAANKVPGVRATIAHDTELARSARADDNTNVLALGADFVDEGRAKEVITTWLTTDFSGDERHIRRLDKIAQLEK